MSTLMSGQGAAATPKRLGRFELKRVLGQGAQATVWLAHDARLDREVALKLLARGAAGVAVHEWLHEAQAVSRLTHPHIVPVFEADEHAGQPYLVFEYVQGPTLAELMKRRGALPAAEAVRLMLGVLDALRVAHASGIVHRDLKPSNILVDGEGRARVMDFGIAARVTPGASARHERVIVGTPGYMSPEAARGDAPTGSMDVFAVGVMLAELLAGRRLLAERDPYKAVQRVQQEDLLLPDGLSHPVDDALRAIVNRALARSAGERHASAVTLHQALARWAQPGEAQAEAADAATSGTLEFLLRRMRHKTDFPALSDAVGRIQRVANSENENLNSLSDEILKDVALTNKLLRLVNTAHFGQAGGGSISTVSRAIALVGFAGIRNMALSLVLLEHMSDKAHAQQLKEEFLRALMAGSLAGELSSSARETEECFIGAMFQNLGRLLTEFYFPEEALQIRRLASPARQGPADAAPPSADVAAQRVLGISFEELGVGVARSWGLPDALQKSMRKPQGEAPAKPAERGPERMRWLGAAANEIADAMLEGDPETARSRVAGVVKRYGRVAEFGEKDVLAAQEAARAKLASLAQAMGVKVAPNSPARRLIATPPRAADADHDSLAPHQLQATLPAPLDLGADDAKTLVLGPPPEQAAAMLAAGIQDITNHMVADNFKLNEVLRMILETMFRALGFRRVVFCLRDPKTETLTGRFGLGEGADRVSAAFKVPLRVAPGTSADLFTAVCLKGADTLIADTGAAASIHARLPAWFRTGVNAPAFLLLPLMMKNAPFALIYADKAQAGAIALDEKALSLLRTLRNQAVMAFRQAT